MAVPRFLHDFEYHLVEGAAFRPVTVKISCDGFPLGGATGIEGGVAASLVHNDPRLECVKNTPTQSPSLAHPVIWGAYKDSAFDRKTYLKPYHKVLFKIEKEKKLCLPCGEEVSVHQNRISG